MYSIRVLMHQDVLFIIQLKPNRKGWSRISNYWVSHAAGKGTGPGKSGFVIKGKHSTVPTLVFYKLLGEVKLIKVKFINEIREDKGKRWELTESECWGETTGHDLTFSGVDGLWQTVPREGPARARMSSKDCLYTIFLHTQNQKPRLPWKPSKALRF